MISIADAKNHLPALIHQAETERTVTISRRGRPVAVLVSVTEYDRLVRAAEAAPSWMAGLDDWRARMPADLEGLSETELDAARDREAFAPRIDFSSDDYAELDAVASAPIAAEPARPYRPRRK
ncbi:type II toxin-antitoxin system Phd/YefM family antitoxin [Pseudothauera rhizosphaerae]|uniref:Antitoxin n=1 Tax=Pseudothauera rhizosphaerae TaxID=2565932 RepID=A0A4V3WBZ5_9RHOO|nr:type II toxin-antitoxin system Phd/YefM family antitoxin [Pseudothauera rhizosphaerae]THF65092.1 type II toxin-antitoxin system Phd/YefM family antitoxin [Pseudothauera rhizosphaerae]